MPVDPDKRGAFLDYLHKTHKEDAENIVFKMNGPVAKIPFMSPMLTWATGGGVPIGHFGRWYGPEGSGKSLTNWGLIWAAQNYPEIISSWYEIDIKFLERNNKKLAAVQKKKELKGLLDRFPNGMETILFDTEQRADEDFASKIGVDMKRVELINNNIIEEIIQDATYALEAYHIVIIDSATNAQSVAEAALDPGQYERGTSAAAWKRLRQFRKKMDRKENILIVVDQVRTQLGQVNHKGQAAVTPPNVRFLRHNSSLSIEYTAGKHLYLDKNMQLTDDWEKADTNIRSLGTNGKEPHGMQMGCKVIKNSTGKPHRNARMRFQFPVADIRTGELMQGVGFDPDFELAEIAAHFDIIEKGSGGRYYPLDENFERQLVKVGGAKSKKTKEFSYHGEAAVRRAIAEDEELQARILERLRRDMV